MDDILKFDWNNEGELNANLKKWAYNYDLIIMEQDEDLLFHDIEWTKHVLPFVFDKECIKREYIVGNFSDFIRQCFLLRKENEIKQIQSLFIPGLTAFYLETTDKLIGNCIDYFLSCKLIFDTPKQANIEQVKHVGKLLLNGLTNVAKINEPTITVSGNYQITSTSSVICHICIDRKTGNYKYNGYSPCD